MSSVLAVILMPNVVAVSFVSVIAPVADSFTASPFAFATSKAMSPVLSMSRFAPSPEAVALRANESTSELLRKMPPLVVVTVMAAALVSILLSDAPTLVPFNETEPAVTLTVSPFPSFIPPVALRLMVASSAVAVTEPSVRSPTVVIEMFPPPAVAEVTVTAFLLAKKTPPEAPPSAVKELTEDSIASLDVPMTFDAEMRKVAKQRMRRLRNRDIVDEEDIVLSAFASFCLSARSG